MTNRVLVDQSGLKISRPTVNVLTASAYSDFLFFSEYQTMHLYMWGEAQLADVAGTFAEYDLPFGETLPDKPFVSSMFAYPTTPTVWYHPMEGGDSRLQHWVYNDHVRFFNTSDFKLLIRYSLWRPVP